jgi:hypothetical protein
MIYYSVIICFYTWYIIAYKAINLKVNALVESVDPILLTREDNSIQHFIWVISLFLLAFFSKNTIFLIRGNNSNKMLDGVVFSCQQIGVNTFYKCIEFQVNNFDSYWANLIILKTNLLTREDNSIQHFIWVIPPFLLRISSKNTISQ